MNWLALDIALVVLCVLVLGLVGHDLYRRSKALKADAASLSAGMAEIQSALGRIQR